MAKKQHLYEIDLMRAFIMLSVLSVHTLSRYIEMEPNSLTRSVFFLGGFLSTLHYTREAFMFITGLVLFVTYYHKDFHPFQFWRKRFLLVGIPYVFWNLAYIFFGGATGSSFNWSAGAIWHDLLHSLLFGNQFYLYYVLVTIQLYILFPFLLYALRKLERWHLHVFIGSFLLEVFFMCVTKLALPHIHAAALPGILKELDAYYGRFVLTYQFWFVAGGVLACHYQQVLAFFENHKRFLWITLASGLVIFYAHYVVDWSVLKEGSLAYTVMQPIMIPYSLMITAVMWQLGVKWARMRKVPSWKLFSKYVRIGSTASFGMFLIQPFPLYVMEAVVRRMNVPGWVHFASLPISILFVYSASMFCAYWIGKIPLVAYCVGQKINLKRQHTQTVSAAAS